MPIQERQKEYLKSDWFFQGDSYASVGKVNQFRLGLQKSSHQEDEIDTPLDASEHSERFIHSKDLEAKLKWTKKTMQIKN